MPKSKGKKRKTKSCDRGYPCGGSCISRGFKCRKKLRGQASTYASWLKKQGDSLGGDFNKEAGKRLSVAANKKIEVTRTDKALEEDLFSDTFEALDKGDRAILNSDKVMLKKAEDFLRLNIGDRAENEAKISELTEAIKKREERMKRSNDRTPRNKINPFKRRDNIDKDISKLNKSRNNLFSQLENLKDLVDGKANQIVPFKKKRSQDFSESPANLLNRYFSLKKKIEALMADLETQLKAIANGTN